MADDIRAGGSAFDDDTDTIDIPQGLIGDINVLDDQSQLEEIESQKHTDYRPKILITGAKGQLGIDLVDVLQTDYRLILTDIEEMDITNPDDVVSNFTLNEPDICIHAAAFTNVDACEAHQEEAFRLNAIGTQNVALACQDFDTRLVYISTDYVFDGTARRPIRECIPTNPINVYGESKLMGEQIVRHLVMQHYIVRTSWLFGAYGINFVKTMLKLSIEKEEIGVVDDQFGRPTYSRDLARAIAYLINSPFYGTYHVANTGETSWCGFAKRIFELAGLKTTVKPLTTQEFPRPAKRPAYSVLDDCMWVTRGFPKLRHWEDALREFLEHPNVIKDFPFLKKI